MPVKPGSVFVKVPLLIGSDIFLKSFCVPRVFALNSKGLIVLLATVTELSKEINLELKISDLLFANLTVDPLTLFTK